MKKELEDHKKFQLTFKRSKIKREALIDGQKLTLKILKRKKDSIGVQNIGAHDKLFIYVHKPKSY